MKSIRKTLTRRLSITISLLVIVVLLAADIGVDTWVQREFNQGLKAKVGMLQSLVNEDLDGVEFEFAGEYFPEFEGASSPEYFQLWYKGQVFEKSESLALYTVDELPFENLSLNETVINDITLPDGRSGRIIQQLSGGCVCDNHGVALHFASDAIECFAVFRVNLRHVFGVNNTPGTTIWQRNVVNHRLV